MLNSLYKKCLVLAAHKSSKFFLGLVSFIESSFFPIPPDVMIIPMVFAKKKEFFKIFLIATIFSVLGGIFGYLLGSFFFDFASHIIGIYGYEEKMIRIKNDLNDGTGFFAWLGILFLAGFTPLPYKVFTIASGLVGFNLIVFILVSIISRGLRFFIISFLSYKFGDLFTKFMENHGSKWFSIIGVLIVLLFGVVLYVLKHTS
tara:strand:- start:602 stop:1207 length:606 start_codon:yes stop_codon:yes gene_type:complete